MNGMAERFVAVPQGGISPRILIFQADQRRLIPPCGTATFLS
jgi:hypothetical protein